MNENISTKKSIFRRKQFWMILVYLVLLIWSDAYRWGQPEKAVSGNRKTVFVRAVSGETETSEKIRLAYQEYSPEKASGEIPVVLIHGSPGDSDAFDGLAKLLKNRRLIAVDLPGFGDSEKNVPDYSIRAHARYVLELLDKLKIEKAHILGFSMGGGVVLNMADIAPNRVESISMVSAIGVQEDELLGDYYLNHLIHGLQLGAFWAVQELTPHFGIFDGAISYARNFYDTNQRPLREILQKVDAPVLIIHGRDDPLVPVEAAREHARLVPQSEYIELEDNHFYVFMRPAKISQILEDFWQKAENGEARTRTTADPERAEKSRQPVAPQILRARGATIFVFFLFFALIGFLFEDPAFLLAGIFAAQGRFSFAFALIACLFGIYLGGFLVFLLGRFFGVKILQSIPFRWFVTTEEVEKFTGWITENKLRAVFLNRNWAGFRLPSYFLAGKLRRDFWRFFFGFWAAATIWGAILIGLSFLAAAGLIQFSFIHQQNSWGLCGLIFGFYMLVRIGMKFSARAQSRADVRQDQAENKKPAGRKAPDKLSRKG